MFTEFHKIQIQNYHSDRHVGPWVKSNLLTDWASQMLVSEEVHKVSFALPCQYFSERLLLSHKGSDTRGYQKVLSLTWKEPEIWIYSALFFNVVPFQLHTLVPSSFPVINTRSVEVNILVP